MGMFFKNISRYVHFRVLAFLWILITIKLSIDWGIKCQIFRNLGFCWPENCAILSLANTRHWNKFPGSPRLKKVLNRSKYNFQSSKVWLENILVIAQEVPVISVIPIIPVITTISKSLQQQQSWPIQTNRIKVMIVNSEMSVNSKKNVGKY